MNIKNKTITAVVSAALTGIGSAAVNIDSMPHWVYADTEVATNCPISMLRHPVEDLQFSLEFSGCESNNVEVAFGYDANTNGLLEVSERGLSVAWDCGGWIMRSLGEEGFACGPSDTNDERRLDFKMHVSGYKMKRIQTFENFSPMEWNVGGELPDWMFDPRWNVVRLSVRGVDVSCGSFRAAVTIDALQIRIR